MKDKIIEILKNNSQTSVIGWAVEEDDFIRTANQIEQLLSTPTKTEQKDYNTCKNCGCSITIRRNTVALCTCGHAEPTEQTEPMKNKVEQKCNCTAPRRQDSMGQQLFICTECGTIHTTELTTKPEQKDLIKKVIELDEKDELYEDKPEQTEPKEMDAEEWCKREGIVPSIYEGYRDGRNEPYRFYNIMNQFAKSRSETVPKDGMSAEEWLESENKAYLQAMKIYSSITSYSNRSELGGIEKPWIIECIKNGLSQFAQSNRL